MSSLPSTSVSRTTASRTTIERPWKVIAKDEVARPRHAGIEGIRA